MVGAIIGLLSGAVTISGLATAIDESLDYLGWGIGLVGGGFFGAKIAEYVHRKVSSGSE